MTQCFPVENHSVEMHKIMRVRVSGDTYFALILEFRVCTGRPPSFLRLFLCGFPGKHVSV